MGLATADHIPVSMFISVKGLPELVCSDSHKSGEILDWATLLTDVHFRDIEVPVDAIMCVDADVRM